jgi:histone H3/H4
MSRQRLAELSKKLNVGQKPARAPRPTKAEAAKKANEGSFRSFSKLSTKQQDMLAPEDDDMLSDLSYIHQTPSADDKSMFIDMDHAPVSGPQLTDESFEQFESELPAKPVESAPKKTATRGRQPVAKPVEENSAMSSFDDEYVDDDDNDSIVSIPVERPASAKGKNRTAPSVTPMQEQPVRMNRYETSETVPRQAIIRLIRSSNLSSAGAELVDAVKELVVEFTKTVLTEVADPQRQITSTNLHRYIGFFIKNEENDMNQDVVLSPGHFQRLIQPICNEERYVIKRDSFYLLHLFVETVIVKILQGSDMVADAAKRQRVSAKDVLVAYSIYMM